MDSSNTHFIPVAQPHHIMPPSDVPAPSDGSSVPAPSFDEAADGVDNTSIDDDNDGDEENRGVYVVETV